MKILKKIIVVFFAICICSPAAAFASDGQHLDTSDAEVAISLNDEIGFALYRMKTENVLQEQTSIILRANKNIQTIHIKDIFITRVITKRFQSTLLLLILLMMVRLQLVMIQNLQFL